MSKDRPRHQSRKPRARRQAPPASRPLAGARLARVAAQAAVLARIAHT